MKIISMDKETGIMVKLQALVPEEKAEQFQAVCKRRGFTQEVVFGHLAMLFARLPEPMQGALDYALEDGEAFTAFMQAVDRVIAEAILARLPSLGRIPEVDELRGRIAALEESGPARQRQPGLRRAGGKST